MRRREQKVERSCCRRPEKGSALGANGVHYDAQIIHPFFERRQLVKRDWVRQTCAPFVEKNKTTERGKSVKQAGDAWLFPEMLYVRNPTMHEHQIKRSIPSHLVGNVNTTAFDVSSLGGHHANDGSTF